MPWAYYPKDGRPKKTKHWLATFGAKFHASRTYASLRSKAMLAIPKMNAQIDLQPRRLLRENESDQGVAPVR